MQWIARRFVLVFLVAGCGVPGSYVIPPAEEGVKKEEGKLVPKVIYGEDDRLDYYQVSSELKVLADSTVALVSRSDVYEKSGGGLGLITSNYGTSNSLCSSEPFAKQETAAFCSGTLVGEDLILTAGHCIRKQSDCESTVFVFGFNSPEKGVIQKDFSEDDVYSCKEIIHSEVSNNGVDYAVIRLERAVVGREALSLKRDQELGVGDSIFVIGHPSGLPTKIAGGAEVRSLTGDRYYTANLDTYGGNSGSAVFDSESGLVAGVLVRGEQDFVRRGSCYVSNRCEDGSCRGEDITMISQVLAYVPEIEEPEPPHSGGTYTQAQGVSVPDNTPVGVTSSIVVDSSFVVRKISVHVEIKHTWIGDLRVSLVAPSGREVVLHNRSGGYMDDIRGTYGEELSSVQALGGLVGENSKGLWKLKISDHARLDSGNVESWSIRLN